MRSCLVTLLLIKITLPWLVDVGSDERSGQYRMIHAGLSGRSVAWFRRTQLAMAALCAAPLGAGLLTGLLPGAVVGPWLLASLAIGVLAPLLMLSHRSAQRRQTFRRELVGILYDLAGLVTAGMTLEAALHELAGEEGDFHAELRAALVLTGAGVALDETHTHQPNAARAGSRSNWEVLGLVLRRLRRQPTPKQR